jgi:hypothetical protein
MTPLELGVNASAHWTSSSLRQAPTPDVEAQQAKNNIKSIATLRRYDDGSIFRATLPMIAMPPFPAIAALVACSAITVVRGAALGQQARAAHAVNSGLFSEDVRRVGRVYIPHHARQVISDDDDEFNVLHRSFAVHFRSPAKY